MKILTAEQMRQIDAECIRRGTPVNVLMENAGKAVAAETRNCLGAMENQYILCLAGAGNNGGDGLVAARYLYDWGAKVSVYLCSRREDGDENLRLLKERGITCIEAASDDNLKEYDKLLVTATCVIDALLGTGRMRPLEGVYRQVLEKANRKRQEKKSTLVAVDLPSGMDADTGAVDPACPFADLTVTLAFPKLGLFNFPGAERVGRLKIVDIGIPESLAGSIEIELMTDAWAGNALPPRPLGANKGTFGRVLVAAGSTNYIGAAYLACSGAMRVGAGLVTLATGASLQPILATRLSEATFLPLPELHSGVTSVEAADVIHQSCGQYDILLIGCGLGQHSATVEFASSLLLKEELYQFLLLVNRPSDQIYLLKLILPLEFLVSVLRFGQMSLGYQLSWCDRGLLLALQIQHYFG